MGEHIRDQIIQRFTDLSNKCGKIREESGDTTVERDEIFREYKEGPSKEESELRDYLNSISYEYRLSIAVLMELGRDRVKYPNDFAEFKGSAESRIKRYREKMAQRSAPDAPVDYICDIVQASNTYGFFASGYEWFCKMKEINPQIVEVL